MEVLRVQFEVFGGKMSLTTPSLSAEQGHSDQQALPADWRFNAMIT